MQITDPKFIAIFIAALVVIAIIVILGFRYQKNQGAKFADQHQDAATIYLNSAKGTMVAALALSDQLAIVGVDGMYVSGQMATDVDTSSANLVVDRQRSKDTFLLIPGKMIIVPGPHTLALAAQHSRPGVLSKTVTTTYGPVKVNVNLEPHKDYQLTFDRDSQQFGLVERAA